MYLPLPKELTVTSSPIHGLGLFCTRSVAKGHEFGVTHVRNSNFTHGWIRTPLGGFYNHSDVPNCEKKLTQQGNVYVLVASRDIAAGEEITAQYTLYSVKEWG